MWKVAEVISPSRSFVFDLAVERYTSAIRQLRVVLATVQVLDKKLDDGRLVLRKVDLALVRLLFALCQC
jgi:hypothetical protein